MKSAEIHFRRRCLRQIKCKWMRNKTGKNKYGILCRG
jgi:hypothetical protein